MSLFAKIGSQTRVNSTAASDQFWSAQTQLANGDIMVVWTEGSLADAATDPDFAVKAQRLSSTGAKIGAEITLDSGSTVFTEPDIVALPDGGYAISYSRSTGSSYDALLWDGPVQMGVNGTAVTAYSVRFDSDDVEQDRQFHGVRDHTYIFPHDPGMAVGEIRLQDGFDKHSDTALIAGPGISGQYLVLGELDQKFYMGTHPWGDTYYRESSGVFIDDTLDSTTEGVYAAYDEDSSEGWGFYNDTPPDPLDYDRFDDVAAANLGNGSFVVTYTRYTATAPRPHYAVVMELWDVNRPQSLPLKLESSVIGELADDNVQSSVAALAGGGYVIAYTQLHPTSGDTDESSVRLRLFDSDGSARNGGGEIQVNGSTVGSQHEARVAGLADGRFVVVWTDDGGANGDAGGTAVRAQVFTAAGEKSGGEFLVAATTAENQGNPAITALANGNFMVSWTDWSSGSADVRSQIFDPRDMTGGSGGETLHGGSMNDTMFGNGGVDVLEGHEGDDAMNGGEAGDTLRGGKGNDVINGDAGADDMSGGQGDDTYFVDQSGDVVNERFGEGRDTVWSSVDFTLGANVEILRSLATSGATALTGNAEDNSIYGSTAADDTISGLRGDDTLWGQGGDDTLSGALGQDTMDGGSGGDTMAGGDGDDTYYVDSLDDVVREDAHGGSFDRVISKVSITLADHVEALVLAASAADAVGNGLDNSITGNGKGNIISGMIGMDGIFGMGGGDTLDGGKGLDFINGGEGADAIDGGKGVDYADYSTSADGVRVNLSNGTASGGEAEGDTLAHIEYLIGSAADDKLTGSDADNELYGNGGADEIRGGKGVDTLSGGIGDDIYILKAVHDSKDGRADNILDFNLLAGEHDVIDLSQIDANEDISSPGDQAFVFVSGGITGLGQISAFQSGADAVVEINTDGDDTPEMEIVIRNFTAANLSIADFIA